MFANKAVFQTYGFHFTFALTEVHTVFTLLGMLVMARLGVFETKRLPQRALMQLAAAYVGYIVLCNLSLKVNTVGFYQVSLGQGRRGGSGWTQCERTSSALCFCHLSLRFNMVDFY